ncbi:hypothetical protein V475_12685 [Sphingobium baderi LL03]|uniref:Uncharacterized protein n=1 Tax=Sphingobium baderi LL03 TaxID=1114964 RepID=T0G4B7_9SPHN|nr:hypothetical protein L485_17760 [Sphingobium baderi LL03]KMS61652.1 hypothetical protein V475_12685 [Sphingobium baderi LL03]
MRFDPDGTDAHPAPRSGLKRLARAVSAFTEAAFRPVETGSGAKG